MIFIINTKIKTMSLSDFQNDAVQNAAEVLGGRVNFTTEIRNLFGETAANEWKHYRKHTLGMSTHDKWSGAETYSWKKVWAFNEFAKATADKYPGLLDKVNFPHRNEEAYQNIFS